VLDTALNYLKFGWSVIPVSRDKRPLIEWEAYQKRLATEEEIRAWWKRWPKANIGVVTGAISGVVVVDIDSKNSGELFSKVLNNTLVVRTGRTDSRGLHVYFKHPGTHVPNAVGILPGVDVRGDGGYVVVPPSVHSSGRSYTWENKRTPVSLPVFLRKILIKGSTVTEEDWEVVIPKGQRDEELTRRAGKLIQAGIPAPEALSMLSAWNRAHCHPPVNESQVEKIIKSVAKAEAKNHPDRHTEGALTTSFSVLTFEETLEKYGMQEVKWLIDEWFPEATMAFLIAPPGTYKTWLLLDLALSISTGKPFLNQYEVYDTGPVLFVQQEDPFGMLFQRLGSIMGIGEVVVEGEQHTVPLPPPFPPIYWHPDRKLNFSKKETVKGLEHAIQELKPKLVVIDPLYSAADTKDYMAESAQLMLELKRMRDTYGCAFAVAHHTTKKGETGEREELWGSQFLNAWLETGWQIRKRSETAISLRRHFKHKKSPNYVQIEFDITTWSFKAHVTDSEDDADIKSRISELLDTAEVTSYGQVAEALGLGGKGTVSRIFKELKVKKVGKTYKMP